MDEAAEVDPASFDAVLARATPEQWAELEAALAELEASGPPYADWSPLRRSDSGVLTLPYPTYRPAAERLRRAAPPRRRGLRGRVPVAGLARWGTVRGAVRARRRPGP